MRDWTFRGTALDSFGTVTLVTDFLKMPARRGDNILIPFRDGRIYAQKRFEQRVMTLGIEIFTDSVQDLEGQLDALKTLMGIRGLGTLQVTMDDGSIRNASAEAHGDLNLRRVAPQWIRGVLDFTLPEPFFRSTTLNTITQTIDASPKTFTLNNPGTAEERKPKIVLTGPLSNTEITNTTNGVSVKYNGTISAGDTVTIDIDPSTGEYTAQHSVSGNVIGNVTHQGDSALMVLQAGDNSMSVTDATATTGTVKVEFYAPYL